VPNDVVAKAGRVTFIENEIENMQHNIKAAGKFVSRRYLIGNMRVANFAFGANDALRERGRGNQESVRDLLGFQAANFSEREGDARVRRERRVAAGKNQSEPIVP
jgi:hypothetical protein